MTDINKEIQKIRDEEKRKADKRIAKLLKLQEEEKRKKIREGKRPEGEEAGPAPAPEPKLTGKQLNRKKIFKLGRKPRVEYEYKMKSGKVYVNISWIKPEGGGRTSMDFTKDGATYNAYFKEDHEMKTSDIYTTYDELMSKYKIPRDKVETFKETRFYPFDGDTADLANNMRTFFTSRNKVFKTNMTTAYILGHVRPSGLENGVVRMLTDTTGKSEKGINLDHRFDMYMIYNNTDLFYEREKVIKNRKDMSAVLDKIEKENIMESASIRRPSTQWVFIHFLHVRAHVFDMEQVFGSNVAIPQELVVNPAVMTLGGFEDNLCLFRSLAIHKYKVRPDRSTKKAKDLFYEFYGTKYNNEYNGFGDNLIYKLEEHFNIAINTYSYDATDKTVSLEHLSQSNSKEEMSLLSLDNHVAYIKDISHFLESFKCPRCQSLYKTNVILQRHMKTCDALCKHKFVGGYYENRKTVFEKMQIWGIDIQGVKDVFHDYYAVFDFECFLKQIEIIRKSTSYKCEHVPSSVSVCSNVPGYTEPKCIIDFDGDVQKFINEWIEYLMKIAKKSEKKMKRKFNILYERLEHLQETIEPKKRKCIGGLVRELDSFCECLPVLGFNSGHYDLPAIKKYLFNALEKFEEEEEEDEDGEKEVDSRSFVIPKGSGYMAISTKHMKFLDITNYLSPGFDYDTFIKAYECEFTKGYFPYEWFDGRDKLMKTKFPKHKDFYSGLKGRNITKEEYEECVKVWNSLEKDKDGKTYFHQFLKHYNDLDVVPFVEAIGKMFDFYRNRGVDMFQDGVSVPGLSLRMAFAGMKEDVKFSLFEEKDKEYYYDMRNNIVGGPSIIFNRHQEAGKTKIRKYIQKNGEWVLNPNAKTTQSILGLDANALYLWASMQEMPGGDYKIHETLSIEDVMNDKFFGFVMCDIYTPDHLKDYFSVLPPIFKNSEIEAKDVGEHMQEYMNATGCKIGKGRKLISSYIGDHILLYTPLIKWYIKMGLVVKKIYYGLEYIHPSACFKEFGEQISDSRRNADKDPSKKIIAETDKLTGNSFYGKTATNKEKHTCAKYVCKDKVPKLIAKHTFKDLNQLGEDSFEVKQFKSKIKMDLPIQIACAVYQLAKLRMLDFIYNCMDKFIDRSNYEMCEMDTDSDYVGLGFKSWEECIKPELRQTYEEEKHLWFPREVSPGVVLFDKGEFAGMSVDAVIKKGIDGYNYCENIYNNPEGVSPAIVKRIEELMNAMYDKRTPGLFKEEFKGSGIVSLCSKTYFCWDDAGKNKFSSKGVNKKINNITRERYLKVLETGNAEKVINKGFRMRDNAMMTYEQQKTGFSYLYVKRKVLEDGITTIPLEI